MLGIGVFTGNSGILSFGHVAFIGLGAYVSGLLTIPVATKASVLPALPAFLATTEMSLLPALVITLVLVGLFAAAVGIPIARMTGAAAVIGTLGLLLIVHGIIIGAEDFTRGSNAFLGVPRRTGLWTATIFALLALLAARRLSGVGLRGAAAGQPRGRAGGPLRSGSMSRAGASAPGW